jgi:ribose 5-phosphate isomerase B
MSKIYIATDHAGFELKNRLVPFLQSLGHEVTDCGAHVYDVADDYPGFIADAAHKLSVDASAGKDSRALVIGASGQGEAMVANRFKGVRCALYYGAPRGSQIDAAGKELNMLQSTRIHNNANALSIGARFLSDDEVKAALTVWLGTEFSNEERHARRVQQIDQQ